MAHNGHTAGASQQVNHDCDTECTWSCREMASAALTSLLQCRCHNQLLHWCSGIGFSTRCHRFTPQMQAHVDALDHHCHYRLPAAATVRTYAKSSMIHYERLPSGNDPMM